MKLIKNSATKLNKIMLAHNGIDMASAINFNRDTINNFVVRLS